jgi:2-polyprenyl-3-methyl-5-hydroxy-6-metoxy-1,4-benzoquinol methylase
MDDSANASLSPDYALRLKQLQRAAWKRFVDVQAPYRANLQRLRRGLTLDVGCGVGRNLRNLGENVVGIDPNRDCVAAARAEGFLAYAPHELPEMMFDTLLFAHVLEHVAEPQDLVHSYLPRLRPGGQVILITPQEAGYASDPTHVHFLDFDGLTDVVEKTGLQSRRAFSFPFPRWVGPLFAYNEFVVVADLPRT